MDHRSTNHTMQLPELEVSQQAVQYLVESLDWSYAVIWKLRPDNRTLVWHQGFFNTRGAEAGKARLAILFESIYKRCVFTYSSRPGYALLSWQQQSRSLWWTRLMDPVPTDIQKEIFLLQAGIETIVCLPFEAPDGTTCCMELATDSLVPRTESLQAMVQDFLNDSVAPHISVGLDPPSSTAAEIGPIFLMRPESQPAPVPQSLGRESRPLVATEPGPASTTLSLTGASPSTIHGSEAFSGFDTILRPEEPYFPWTASGSIAQQYGPGFQNLNPENLHSLDLGSSYSALIHQYQGLPGDWSPLKPLAPSPEPSAGPNQKGKEIVPLEHLDQTNVSLPNPRLQAHKEALASSSFAQSLDLEISGQFQTPITAPDLVTSRTSGTQVYRNSVKMANREACQNFSGSSSQPSTSTQKDQDIEHSRLTWFRHSRRSPFQVDSGHSRSIPSHLGLHRPRGQSMIQRWRAYIVPKMINRRRQEFLRVEAGGPAGGSSGEYDSRSPPSDTQAHLHKLAERDRRLKFNGRLQTLISIVPIIKKKDKVSVLTSTIEYIRHLTSHIATLEKEAPPVPRSHEGATSGAPSSLGVGDDPSAPLDQSTAVHGPIPGAGAASSSSNAVVFVELLPGGNRLRIKVEASDHPQSLIQFLTMLKDLGLELITLDYGSGNGRFLATVAVGMPRNQNLSSILVQEALQRVLDSIGVDSSPSTCSD